MSRQTDCSPDLIHTLYDGAVRLEFNPQSHRYTVQDGDRTIRPVSVTTVCGVIDKPALIGWAVNQTLEVCRGAIQPNTPYPEVILEEIWSQAKANYRRTKQEAASIGTEVHSRLEGIFRSAEDSGSDRSVSGEGRPEGDEERLVRIAACVNAATEWLAGHAVTPVEIERRIYSRKHRYSGTLDKLAMVDGELALIDWKTSNAIHPEYRLQTAAYVAAYEEEFPKRKIHKRYLIRLGKDDGAFEAHEYGRIDQKRDFSAFLGALRLYRRLQEIK